jgi:peptidoglycan/xylan/chitin deacetylase (PgdA/CDA1 family)
MRLLSPILKRVVYPSLGRLGYLHSCRSGVLKVVTYHGLMPIGHKSKDPILDGSLVSVESFRSQLRLLKKHYNVLCPDELRSWLRQQRSLPESAVVLTCDDGLLNHLTDMLPILQEERLKCLFFVTGTSLQDAPEMLWYIELYLMLKKAHERTQPVSWKGISLPRIPAEPSDRRVIWLELFKPLSRFDEAGRRSFLDEATRWWGLSPSWKRMYLDDPFHRNLVQLLGLHELKQLVAAGMTIGAHTFSHPALVEQPEDLARVEIAGCRQALEKALGQPIWALAYPFGDSLSVGEREYQLAEAAGYECAFMNTGGPWRSACCRFSLPRVHITSEMSLPVYEAHISGFHDTLQKVFRGRSK